MPGDLRLLSVNPSGWAAGNPSGIAIAGFGGSVEMHSGSDRAIANRSHPCEYWIKSLYLSIAGIGAVRLVASCPAALIRTASPPRPFRSSCKTRSKVTYRSIKSSRISNAAFADTLIACITAPRTGSSAMNLISAQSPSASQPEPSRRLAVTHFARYGSQDGFGTAFVRVKSAKSLGKTELCTDGTGLRGGKGVCRVPRCVADDR